MRTFLFGVFVQSHRAQSRKVILSGILYTLAACVDCFPCGKREKKKEAVIRDEEAMLERNSEDKFRPSSEFTKGSSSSQEVSRAVNVTEDRLY